MKTITKKVSLLLMLALLTVTINCSDDNPTGSGDEPETGSVKYFIAAEQGEGTYMLTVDDLSVNDTTTTINNGIENPQTYTHYAYNGTDAVLALGYQQGNPAVGVMYGLDETGNLVKTGNDFELTNSFSSIGSVGDYIITQKSGRTLSDETTGAIFYFLDLANNNYITEKAITTDNLFGNGLNANFIGIVEAGEGEFFAGVEFDDGSVDSVYIAKLDTELNVVQFYKDGRLSRSGGQYRSARYDQIGNDDEGNTYVFSGSYSTETVHNAGALLIKKGASGFDTDYYFDIEALSGGYRFRKVWHAIEDYFLLEFYNDIEYGGTSSASQYAVVKMSDKTFSWVSGLPAKDAITDTGWPYPADGNVYFPITTADDQPAVYVIDPTTATATKGIVVNGAESIGAVAKFTFE